MKKLTILLLVFIIAQAFFLINYVYADQYRIQKEIKASANSDTILAKPEKTLNFLNCNTDIYLLLPAGKLPQIKFLKSNTIKGISVRVHWQDIEKKQGSYNWTYLDQIFKLARKYNKKVSLRLLGGYYSPKWIYEKQVPFFTINIKVARNKLSQKFLQKHGKSIQLPVVWSIPYLNLWQNFVQAVSKRYNNRPEFTLIHITGINFFSAELILARNKNELELLKKNGFSEEKLLQAWNQLFLFFNRNFDNCIYSINVHYVIKGKIELTKKIIARAHKVFGSKLAIQGNWLDFEYVKKERMNGNLINLFIKAKKIKIIIGFQTIAPILKQCYNKGLDKKKSLSYLAHTLEIGCKFNAKYIEMYPQDLKFFIFEKNN